MLSTIVASSIWAGLKASGVKSCGPRAATSCATRLHGRSARRIETQAGNSKNGKLINSGIR